MKRDIDKFAKLRRAFAARGCLLPGLAEQALTHRSAGKQNYERLEFYGDAILGFLSAQLLFETQPNADEGTLSRLRSAIVDEPALANYARQLDLSDALILGGGELKSGGYRRDSILADAFEALLCAVFLEQGIEAASHFVKPFLQETMTRQLQTGAGKDAKTRLQEWLQAKQRMLPTYQLIGAEGQDHDRRFTVRCLLEDSEQFTNGEGTSLKRAEQTSAHYMLKELGIT